MANWTLFLAVLCLLPMSRTTTTPKPGSCGSAGSLNQSHPNRVDELFSSNVVLNEFIVKFSGFYKESARRGYIDAALSPLSGLESYEVLERNNPMAAYPSDFDVVHVTGGKEAATAALVKHPAIKSVTPQRKITRTLKVVDKDENEEEDEEDGGGGQDLNPCGEGDPDCDTKVNCGENGADCGR
jgi:hypothetical protein